MTADTVSEPPATASGAWTWGAVEGAGAPERDEGADGGTTLGSADAPGAPRRSRAAVRIKRAAGGRDNVDGSPLTARVRICDDTTGTAFHRASWSEEGPEAPEAPEVGALACTDGSSAFDDGGNAGGFCAPPINSAASKAAC